MNKTFDSVIQSITDYVVNYHAPSELALNTAYFSFLDSLACACMALQFPACKKLLGPVVPGATLQNGARVPFTQYELDPVQAAFNIGAMIRWLDYNDTFLAAEWGHPSDNLGSILAVMDYLNRAQGKNFSVKDVLIAMIKAHEIQGVLALENSFNKVGLDHVVLVKVASTAVTTQLFGATRDQINNAVSNAWIDGQSLRTYRHFPNTGSRKSWAAGDATSRAVRLALIAMTGEMGYPTALSAKTWGFYDALFRGKSFSLPRAFGDYVMENVLFKISFPAEFHAQTAVECALKLHSQIKNRLNDIEKIVVTTQESAMRIISKQGPLHNPADRDHCLEYMIAIGLIFGELTAEHYEDNIAKDPRIDALRAKMFVSENPQFTRDYLDPEKRSIGNSIQIFFNDGSKTDQVTIEYPVGHKRRRSEGEPLLREKMKRAFGAHFSADKTHELYALFTDSKRLMGMSVSAIIDCLSP